MFVTVILSTHVANNERVVLKTNRYLEIGYFSIRRSMSQIIN